MTTERIFYELNETNCTLKDNTLTFVIDSNNQSCEGIDFHFSSEFVKDKELNMKSLTVSPAPLMCYWNWMAYHWGAPEYEFTLDNSINISKYQLGGGMGTFGFSGYTNDDSDITVTIELEGEV